jgi:site-specific DNA recombinase
MRELVVQLGRVSSHRQEKEETIETQKKSLDDWCDRENWDVVGRFFDENVASQIPLERRPEGGRLLREIKALAAKRVVVYRLDRVSRYRDVFHAALKLLANQDVGVQSLHDRFETATPQGRLMLNVLLDFAEYERDSILQRCTDGMIRVAEGGGHMGGPTPFGFTVEGHKPRYLVPDWRDKSVEGAIDIRLDGEADTIALIYFLAVKHRMTCPAIANHLNALGIPTACQMKQGAGKSRRHWDNRTISGLWTGERVAFLIRSRIYCGERLYRKHQVVQTPDYTRALVSTPQRVIVQRVPAIVSPEMWVQAQAVLADNRTYCDRNAKRDYLLRSLIRCLGCEYAYCGDHRKDRRYYVCTGRQQRRACTMPSLRADRLEAEVLGLIRHHLAHIPETMAKVRESLGTQQCRERDLIAERDQVLKQREQVELSRRATVRLMTTFDSAGEPLLREADGGQRLQELNQQFDRCRDAVALLDEEIGAVAHQERDLESLETFLATWRAQLNEESSFAEQQQLVRRFVRRIEVLNDPEHGLTVRYVLCFDPVESRAALRAGLVGPYRRLETGVPEGGIDNHTASHTFGNPTLVLPLWELQIVQPWFPRVAHRRLILS